MKTVLAILLSLSSCQLTAAQSILQTKFTVNQYGATVNGLVYLPKGYDSSIKYPAVMFFVGKGESGSNYSLIYVNGPFHFIQSGWQPDFIVACAQAPNQSPLATLSADSALQQLVRNYNADPDRLYLTGLSNGGWTAFNYCAHYQVNPSFKISALVPMSAATTPGWPDAYNIAKDKVQVWGFGSYSDIWGIKTSAGVDSVNKYAPGTAKFTAYTGGHCCWNQFYDPNYKQDGLNIYDWMLRYSHGVLLPVDFISFLIIKEGSGLSVSWQTGSEQNNDRFIIEGSNDGISWHDLATVKSQADNGNSSTVLNYSYRL